MSKRETTDSETTSELSGPQRSKASLAEAIQHRVDLLSMNRSAFVLNTGLEPLELPALMNGEESKTTTEHLQAALETLNLSDDAREINDMMNGVEPPVAPRKVEAPSRLPKAVTESSGIKLESVPTPEEDYSNFKKIIGERIAARRRQLGLKQRELGEKVLLSRESIAQVETGRIEITAGTIPRLCITLNVPVMYFFKGMGLDLAGVSDREIMESLRNPWATTYGEFATNEYYILEDYRGLSERDRKIVQDLVHLMADTEPPSGEQEPQS